MPGPRRACPGPVPVRPDRAPVRSAPASVSFAVAGVPLPHRVCVWLLCLAAAALPDLVPRYHPLRQIPGSRMARVRTRWPGLAAARRLSRVSGRPLGQGSVRRLAPARALYQDRASAWRRDPRRCRR
jgi:hypothetical protein